MHRFKILTLFMVFGLLFTLTLDPVNAFEPDPEDGVIAVSLLATERSNILVGTLVEVYISIKNFSNFTLNNVTIDQPLDDANALKFTESPIGYFNGTEMDYTEVSVVNYITGNNVTLKSFKISPSNFSLNMEKVDIGEEFSFRFEVNVTEAGFISMPNTSLTYYDQYGDQQPAKQSANDIEIRANPIPSNEKEGYFPEIEVDETNYRTISFVALLLLVVALLSRSLYKKKPIE